MLPAGARNRRIEFQRAHHVKSPLGPKVPAEWQHVQMAWAAVSYGRAEERRNAAAEGASAAATFRVLSSAALRALRETDCRILMDGQAWNVTAITPVNGRNFELEFTAIAAKG
ncbi:head-tail adaptor protein [Sphingomonas canadensis]|uniref:Head-tail adaptor protein n=1 Tax=Sphingomonas canadensis TaxID=1219257 RepID=A0ABW3HF14_9SPHN|nr:head-tail adaptor protein [Sphingomonas canadensis]MCW3837813.1 head-tail adaptor protein [Sphingomonas canadensis]